MKISVYLDTVVKVGGGFNQSLNAIILTKRICESNFEFSIFTAYKENLKPLSKLGLHATVLKPSFIDKVILLLSKSLILQTLFDKFNILSQFEKSLQNNKVDLIYFLTQSTTSLILRKTNYITTVFDLCHRDMPEFPEVGSPFEFNRREYYFKHSLTRAFLIITDSKQLSKSISKKYGIDSNRLLAIPYSPSPFINKIYSIDTITVLRIYSLSKGYLFYPAQFWPHKNHIRILEALIHLRNNNLYFNLVFCGSDKGNRINIINFVKRNHLEKQVTFLDFVPAEHMLGLYEGSSTVIMPTYFGPTNLPPLESWTTGTPLIYSMHLKDHASNAAIYTNPDDYKDLAECIKACNDPSIRSKLIQAGYKRLNEINDQRLETENTLKERLIQFQSRRRCWLNRI